MFADNRQMEYPAMTTMTVKIDWLEDLLASNLPFQLRGLLHPPPNDLGADRLLELFVMYWIQSYG